MKATLFMRQPFFVTGYEVTEENMSAIAKWCQGHVIDDVDRPFIRVPVDRPVNKRQTEAYVGTWVLMSSQGSERSFKVYTEEYLAKSFIKVENLIPDEANDEIVVNPQNSEANAHKENVHNNRVLPKTNGRQSNVKPVNFRAGTAGTA